MGIRSLLQDSMIKPSEGGLNTLIIMILILKNPQGMCITTLIHREEKYSLINNKMTQKRLMK
jgi:hypothetical protein